MAVKSAARIVGGWWFKACILFETLIMEGKCIMVLWDDSSKKNMVNTGDL